MKTHQVTSLGILLSILVPSTVDEFNALAWKGATVNAGNPCLDEAIDNTLYRSYLQKFRSTFCETLEEESVKEFPSAADKLKRKTKVIGKKVRSGEDQTAWAETEEEYVKRICGELSVLRSEATGTEVLVTPPQLTNIVTLTLDKKDDAGNPIVAFDPSPKAKGAKKTSVAKVYLDSARAIFGAGKYDGFKTKQADQGYVEPIKDENESDEDYNERLVRAVGLFIQTVKEAQLAKAQAQMAEEFAA